MARVVCVDYEGALVRRDIPVALFERFASPEWRDAYEEFRRGKRARESYLAEALRFVDAPREEVVAYALELAELEPGLPELYDWAQWNDWTLVVLADGFDFYVEPSLDALRLPRLARACARTTPRYRWRAQYLSPRGIALGSHFKLAYVQAYRGVGDFVVYIGGNAAPEAAGAADHCLVRDKTGAGQFASLRDVIGVLEREGEQWWQSWCSSIAAGGSSSSSPGV